MMLKKFFLSLLLVFVFNSPSYGRLTNKSVGAQKSKVIRSKGATLKRGKANSRKARPASASRGKNNTSRASRHQISERQAILRQQEQTRIQQGLLTQQRLQQQETVLREQEKARIQQELLAAQQRQQETARRQQEARFQQVLGASAGEV